jgi:signal transduction histidine kinase
MPTLEPAIARDQMNQDLPHPESERQVGREVAHELNNILTIIQGYADRMMLKNPDNAVLRADLQLISDNARRAVGVIRQATARKS